MKKEKYLHFIASFLIALVLSIPFYTTNVYGSINSISVRGSDGIEGYAKPSDAISFNVQAAISGQTITKDNVFLGSSIKFDSCASSLSNGSQCTLRVVGSGADSFEVRSIPFTVNLFKSDNTLDDSKSGTFTIDNKAPQVKLTVPQSKFSSQQNVVVNYEVADTACDDPSCDGKCAGIKNIRIYTADGAFSQTIDSAAKECAIQSSATIDAKTFNDGLNSIFAKATDRLNTASPEASVTFTVKTTAPQILPDTFSIIRKGMSISSFSSNSIPVDVVVNISGNDLNSNSVTADLSALNPDGNLKNAQGSCISFANNVSVCRWAISFNPKTGGQKTVAINASDTSGNRESLSITKTLVSDNQGPEAQLLTTANTVNGQPIGKSGGNTVAAAFNEATGLNAEDIFLRFGKLKIKADKCEKNSGAWECLWQNVNFASAPSSFASATSSISISSDSADILGNPISGSASVGIIVDNTPPALNAINISPVGGTSQAFAGFFKIGDKIAVVANITEDNDVFADADFSKFISGASNVPGSCKRIQADEQTCTWLTDSINLQNTDVIAFNFSDNAGNTLIVTRSLKTFGVENAASPDFWESTVSCSPKTIDRSLGPLINLKSFCTVKLKQKSASKAVSTVFIGPASCTGDTSILQKVETFNNEVGSASPIIKLTFAKGDLKIDKASLSCSFQIFSKIGSSSDITKNPEIEAAKIELQFSNLPLGELGDQTQKKIDEAIDDANGIWKLMGTINKFINYAKKICQLINTIFNILGLLMVVYMAISVTQSVCRNSVILNNFGVCEALSQTKQTLCGTHSTGSSGGENLKTYSDKFCSYVNCKQSFLWADSVKKFIDTSPGAQYVGPSKDGASTKPDYASDRTIGTGTPRPLSTYMDPKHNLIVATLFVCLPGIVYGLDKYRQIKCLYADCLVNAVGKEGLPVTACEDQKAYATCKYITGELFAFFPWTALIDHYISIIRSSLSNPFAAIGVAIAIFCRQPSCNPATQNFGEFGKTYFSCTGLRLLTLIGDTAKNVQDIIDNGFTIREDYCSRLDKIEK